MRFLHTGDWHLGRTIRGQSRQPEFERVLDEVARVAIDRRVDVMIVAGDVFDSFSPPAEAERLLYDTLGRVLREGTQIVVIAGNHDNTARMDALSGVLKMVNIHTVGSLPKEVADAVLRLPSRDAAESATIVALPWVPERYAIEFADLSGPQEEARSRYQSAVESTIRRACAAFDVGSINILAAHVLIAGSVIGEGSSERKLHIGHNFAVNAASLPTAAQYIALGHVHKPQEMAAPAKSYYAGSLLQLDFGEGGQEKSVNVVEIVPKRPPKIEPVPITGGRQLRTLTIPYDDLPSHAGKYGDDYLRVIVQIDRPVLSLFEQVRELLPNAIDVTPERTDAPAEPAPTQRSGLAPHELLARYYAEKHGGAIRPELVAAFNELYEAESAHASD